MAAYSFSTGASSTLVDVSDNGNHGVISGAKWTTKGRFDKALYFNGTNSWVTVNDAPSLDLTSGMTLEAWIYPTVAMTGWRTVLMKEQPNLYYLSTGVYTAGSSILNGVSKVPARRWTHLSATHDGLRCASLSMECKWRTSHSPEPSRPRMDRYASAETACGENTSKDILMRSASIIGRSRPVKSRRI